MKDHIIIPLLVVGVGLPLVALGTYYVCDNFPVAEEMRIRQTNYIEDQRREAEERRKWLEAKREEERRIREAKEEAERRRREEREEAERRQREEQERLHPEQAFMRNDGKRVTIKGISINLPYEQLKQELANKFSGISKTGTGKLAEHFHGGAAFAYFDRSILFSKKTYIEFNDKTAFGGSIHLFPECVRIDFIDSGINKYENELQKNYGSGKEENSSYESDSPLNYREGVVEGTVVKGSMYDELHTVLRIIDDGIIIVATEKQADIFSTYYNSVFYFGKSIRDSYVKKKIEQERANRDYELKKQKKQREEEERKRKLDARDKEGI